MSVIDGSSGATALVGLPGFVVGAQELVDCEWWLFVETEADLVGCPACGTRAVGHGRRMTAVRDLPVSGRPVVLAWSKRRWRCPDQDCPKRTWVETSDQVAPRASLTRRARKRIADLVNIDEDSIAHAAAVFGVGWATANKAHAEFTDPKIDDKGRLDDVHAIGVDEKRFTNANAKHRTTFTTQVFDLDAGALLDVLEGRSADTLGDWLEAQGDQWCAGITLATLDPAAGYRKALDEHLPNAQRVVDHFHAIKLANQAIDDVRRRVQQETLGHRGRKGDPLFRIRRRLLMGYEVLGDDKFNETLAILRTGDPDGEVAAAWLAKELLRAVYAAGNKLAARGRLVEFYEYCAEVEIPEITRLARTIDRWSDEVLAYHRTGGASNGPVENMHMLAEKIRRTAHGFRNYDNYRRRLLGRLGIKWDTVPVRRIRGRQPHLIA